MSKNLVNANPVQISVSLMSTGAVDLAYGSEDLTPYDEEIMNELDENFSTALQADDFVHGGVLHNVYVFEVDSAGGLVGPWDRVSGTACSDTIREGEAPKDFDLVVMAVANGDPAPTPSTQSQAQQSGAGLVKVKIRKKGPLPIPGGARRVKG